MLPRRSRRNRSQPVLVSVAAATLAVLLAACGSQLDPETVQRVNGGTGAGGVVGPDGEVVAGGEVPGGAGVPGGAVGGTSGDSGAGTSGGTGGGSTGTTGGGAAGGTPDATGGNSATGGAKAKGCDGFKNQTGITDKTITIGNASDISGPVPGLFEASQDAVRAYVAFFNATSDICGRKLALKTYDSRSDSGANQNAYVDACENLFAMVGSMSAFDSGGSTDAERCGLPDIRSAGVTADRQRCSTCYGAQSTIATEFQNAVPDYVLKNHPGAAKKAAMLYIEAGAAAENGELQPKAMEKRGMDFVYVDGIDVAEFNYSSYVQKMKQEGVKYVQMIASTAQFVRLAQAMEAQQFKPEVFMLDPTAYTRDFLENGGDAVEGATLFINFTPFEEAASNKELQLYLSWLQQVKPGAEPSFFGLFSWSAARLFVQEATKLGGDLSRASLVQSVGKVDGWTANGMHSAQRPGPRRTGECWRFIQVKNGKWTPVGGTKYSCSGTTIVN